jgi:hypothetical protein
VTSTPDHAFLHGVYYEVSNVTYTYSLNIIDNERAYGVPGYQIGESEEILAFVYAPLPDVAANSASTTDAQNINLNYSIDDAPLTEPFQVAIYRSPTSDFYTNAPVTTGLVATIPTTDSQGNPSTAIGTHTVTVALPSVIGPDTSGVEPYVFVVANPPGPGHIAERDDSSDTNNAITLSGLTVTIDSAKLVPTQATDLNLYGVFGSEQVNVPIGIQNSSTVEVKGDIKVNVYLSPTPSLNFPSGVFLSVLDLPDFDLQAGSQMNVTVTGTIDGSHLRAGEQYYFVCQLSSQTIALIDSTTGATNRTIEFLGTPDSVPRLFTDGTYFKFVRDTLKDDLVAKEAYPEIALNSPKSFIGNFEGDSLRPYLDSNGIPTIGIGINIPAQIKTVKIKKGKKSESKTVITALGLALAQDVRTYNHRPKSESDLQVLDWLQSQAKEHHWTTAAQRPAFISEANDGALFNQAFESFISTAQQSVGGPQAFNALSGFIRTAVVDVAYNHGSVYDDMAADISDGDYVMAGFDMLNQTRSLTIYNPKARGFVTRLEAEYENLLIEHTTQLGTAHEASP